MTHACGQRLLFFASARENFPRHIFRHIPRPAFDGVERHDPNRAGILPGATMLFIPVPTWTMLALAPAYN